MSTELDTAVIDQPHADAPSPREALIAGLRELADTLDALDGDDERLGLGNPFTQVGMAVSFMHPDDGVAKAAELRRAIGGRFVKDPSDTALVLRRQFGPVARSLSGGYVANESPVYLDIYVSREQACERVVVATETITEKVPDPDAPLVERTRVEETVEWKCAPILDAEDDDEQERKRLDDAAAAAEDFHVEDDGGDEEEI